MKSEFVSTEYFLPKKCSIRPENLSGSHKTLSPISKTTILFPMKQTHICTQYLKMMQLRPKFYNAWNLKWKRWSEIYCIVNTWKILQRCPTMFNNQFMNIYMKHIYLCCRNPRKIVLWTYVFLESFPGKLHILSDSWKGSSSPGCWT